MNEDNGKKYPILRYKYDELHQIAESLKPTKFLRQYNGHEWEYIGAVVDSKETLEKAVDAIENMIEALQEWDKYAGFLASHGVL